MEVHCSSLARPMVCAGFLSFENLPKQESGEAAEEGTAAGELLERMLLGQDIPRQARNGIYFNDEMRFYLKPIVEEINANRSSLVLCEQQIDWQSRSGVRIVGRYDISFIRDGHLYIDDLKYGWGIVEVKENWQLLGYAIGEIIRRGTAFEKIFLRIHQPRPHHEDGSTREWCITYNELLAYKEKIDARFEQIARGNNNLETGRQCKYCAAAPESCPAFSRLFYRSLDVSMAFVQDSLSEREIADQLDQVARAQEVLKIKADSLHQLATQRASKGKIIPGYIPEAQYGDRRWKPEISPEVVEALTGKNILQPQMLSPAQAEKAGVPREFVNALVDRRFTGQKMVRKDASKVADKVFGTEAPVRRG